MMSLSGFHRWHPLVVTSGLTLGFFILSRRWRESFPLWAGRMMERLDVCHGLYIRSRRPKRIILMRHAESEGNVDKGVYRDTPDHALNITALGREQATAAGRKLRDLIGTESVYFMVSPYKRTRMTYDLVRRALDPKTWAMKEDPRLRELDFGNFQDEAEMRTTMEIRNAYGRFWFRFMNGESGADVYDRATAFWESVFRLMDNASADHRFDNYVIVTHGLMMRLILMRYFQWTVEFFDMVWNPANCETWVMERDERGSFRVVTEIVNRRRGGKRGWETPPPPSPKDLQQSDLRSGIAAGLEALQQNEASDWCEPKTFKGKRQRGDGTGEDKTGPLDKASVGGVYANGIPSRVDGCEGVIVRSYNSVRSQEHQRVGREWSSCGGVLSAEGLSMPFSKWS